MIVVQPTDDDPVVGRFPQFLSRLESGYRVRYSPPNRNPSPLRHTAEFRIDDRAGVARVARSRRPYTTADPSPCTVVRRQPACSGRAGRRSWRDQLRRSRVGETAELAAAPG